MVVLQRQLSPSCTYKFYQKSFMKEHFSMSCQVTSNLTSCNDSTTINFIGRNHAAYFIFLNLYHLTIFVSRTIRHFTVCTCRAQMTEMRFVLFSGIHQILSDKFLFSSSLLCFELLPSSKNENNVLSKNLHFKAYKVFLKIPKTISSPQVIIYAYIRKKFKVQKKEVRIVE